MTRPACSSRSIVHRGVTPAILIAALVGSAATWPTGCATGPRDAGPAITATDASWEQALTALAGSQRDHPDERARRAPPPDGLPPGLASSPDAAMDEKARLSLDEALARLTVAPAPPAADEIPPPEEDRAAALKAYLSGRAKRLAGDAAGAEADLRESVALDPGAPEPWRELGEAQLRTGNAAEAKRSFEAALERAPSDVRALEVVSRFALDRRETALAAGLLARLWALPIEQSDPALRLVTAARLGRTLAELGYVRAASEMLSRAADLPEIFTQPTAYQIELGALYRQAGDLRRDAGDGLLRLGDPAGALAEYERASPLPSLNPGALRPRRVFAAMRLGRSAEAARFLVAEAIAAKGRVDEKFEALAGYVAANSEAGPALAAAFAGVAASPDWSPADRALAAGPLTRARAAALPREKAVELLRRRLALAPGDAATARALLARLGAPAPERLIEEWIRVTGSAEASGAAIADIEPLLGRERTAKGLLEAWPRVSAEAASSEAGRLLHARLLAASGAPADADLEFASILDRNPGHPAAAERAALLIRLGRRAEAEAIARGMPDGPGDAARVAKAGVWARLGEVERALDVLGPSLAEAPDGRAPDAEAAILGAQLHARLGRPEECERLFHRAIAADPTREEAFTGLLALYSPRAPLESESKLVATIRRLREADPSSPTLRWLRAQEAAARGQADLAEREMLDLAEEFPARGPVVERLVKLWLDARATDRAREWLRKQIERRPDEAAPTIRLAEVLAAGREPREGAALLEAWLETYPGDAEASRALETILREKLDEGSRADALAEARLASGPRNAETLVELVELRLDRGQTGEAAASLLELADRRTPLRADLSDRLERAIVEAAQRAMEDRRGYDRVAALAEIANTRLGGSDRLAIAELTMLIRANAAADRLAEATLRASRRSERLRLDAVRFVLSEVALRRDPATGAPDAARRRDAITIITHVVSRTEPLPSDLAALWMLAGSQFEDDDQIAAAYRHARSRGTIDAVMDEMAKMTERNDPAAVVDAAMDRAASRRAELAHFLAGNLDGGPHDELTDEFYRLAIRYDPTFAMARNNLGYRMLERGGDVREAAEQIRLAAERRPEEASIADSLGWAAYKLGRFRDEPNPSGGEPVRGAVSLLRRALELARRDENGPFIVPVVADHLGDALWAAGEREQAVEVWKEAKETSERAVRELRDLQRRATADSPRFLRSLARQFKEIEGAGNGAAEKVAAAGEGREPPIAPAGRPAEKPPPSPS